LLWPTRASLADLGLETRIGEPFDPALLSRRSDLLARFYAQRSLDPAGTERTQGVRGAVFNLHARNPLRGVTWWDESVNVVFLLAATREHDHTVFTQRDAVGTLRPTAADYADVAAFRSRLDEDFDYDDLLDEIEPQIADMLTEATAHPGDVVVRSLSRKNIGGYAMIEVIVGLEELNGDAYIALQLGNLLRQLPSVAMYDLADIAFPDAIPDTVDIGGVSFPARYPARHDDLVMRRRRP
jgi:hypothetical protein